MSVSLSLSLCFSLPCFVAPYFFFSLRLSLFTGYFHSTPSQSFSFSFRPLSFALSLSLSHTHTHTPSIIFAPLLLFINIFFLSLHPFLNQPFNQSSSETVYRYFSISISRPISYSLSLSLSLPPSLSFFLSPKAYTYLVEFMPLLSD